MTTVSTNTNLASQVLAELKSVIGALGQGGGLLSGSLYETAQVLRLAPGKESDVEATVEWLLCQQAGDGGWGEVEYPRSRDATTLAIALALRTRSADPRAARAVESAVSFLAGQARYWTTVRPEDLPIAVEVTLPRLLQEAAEAGLAVPVDQYERVTELGRTKRERARKSNIGPGSPHLFAWESWGTDADPDILDASGGVGHSPAATAAWIAAAGRTSGLTQERVKAAGYLSAAAAATRSEVPGVVPTVWPITRFEQIWGLYALLCSGLLRHPDLSDEVEMQLESVSRALRPEGVGMSDFFSCDADCTGALVTVLGAAGRSVNPDVVNRYRQGDHFVTYPMEIGFSLTSTAHCVHALHEMGADAGEWSNSFARIQAPDGRWLVDKWHASWLYPTSQVMFALAGTADSVPLQAAVDGLLHHQRLDGGWGAHGGSSAVETAYAALALKMAADRGVGGTRISTSLAGASRWLLGHHRPYDDEGPRLWVSKDLYRPYRVDRAFELAATLALCSP